MRVRIGVLLLGLAACIGRSDDPLPPKNASVTIAGKRYRLEILRTRKERTAIRDRNPTDRALLLVEARARYHHLSPSSPLTIAFLDAEGKAFQVWRGTGKEQGVTSTKECARALVLPKDAQVEVGSLPAFEGLPPDLSVQEREVLRIDAHPVYVERAETWEERARGLMWRRRMSADDGMIFVYDSPDTRSFWMGNTYIDLDIAFFRKDRTLINVVEMKRYPDPSEDPGDRARSKAEALYVLELNYGWFRGRGLIDKEGNPVRKIRFDFVP